MAHRMIWVCVWFVISFVAVPATAQTKICDELKGEPRAVALKVLQTAHPHDCCDGTILACLAKKPVCPLAVRLANDVCRRAAAGQSRAVIERELARRAASTMSPLVSIEMDSAAIAGEKGAPVEIVAYLRGRCPYCANLTPKLYEIVTSGKLKGKAQLIVRPFPIRSHQHSTLLGKAMLAAARLGQFWPYLLHVYAHFADFAPEKVAEFDSKGKVDAEQIKKLIDAPETEKALVAAKKEGIRNHVDATPTVFIDRRKYEAELTLDAIEDFVEERLEAR